MNNPWPMINARNEARDARYQAHECERKLQIYKDNFEKCEKNYEDLIGMILLYVYEKDITKYEFLQHLVDTGWVKRTEGEEEE